MYKTVMIGDAKVPMLANGATPYRFRQVWEKDLIVFFSSVNDLDETEVVETLLRLGYVMALQAGASGEDTYNQAHDLGEAGYIRWMEQFDAAPSRMAWRDILTLYNGNTKTESAKKNGTDP